MANKAIDSQLDQLEGADPTETETVEYTKVYQVYPNSKIPVSKHLGLFWSNRQKEGVAVLENSGAKPRWDEAIRYYQNDQGNRHNNRKKLSEVGTGRNDEYKYGTENVVFANVSALVPSTYAKNPDIEITATNPEAEQKATLHEALADTLFQRKAAPGINLKPKMRRATVLALLTNLAYLELSYVKKEDSSEAVIDEVMKLSQELQDAKNIKDIAEIEGKLMALDDRVNLLSSSGPKLRVRSPHTVIVDPNSEEVDLSDASYVIVQDYLRTELLRAMYGNRDKETGKWTSIYAPTHVIKADKASTDIQGHDEDINTFSLLDQGEEDYKKYGYSTEAAYKNACRTEVWIVWDKTTRRVLMFHKDDWSMPIWVWDDPYKLTRFYPFFALAFYTDPVQRYARSEVSYYLDQQDEINAINNERARMRHWAASKVFVNTTLIKDVTAVANMLSGKTTDNVMGLQLPDGVKISDAISTLPTPSMQFEGLFDTQAIFQSINRLSSVTPVLQNEQFKTNTTNGAIESYESSTQTRLDEKIDAIEEVLGDIGEALLEMCVQFMPEDQVRALLGSSIVDKAGGWTNDMTPVQFNEAYNFRVVGGSTLKPTSKVKKEQALQLGQVLGQFASATPAVLLVALKALERAFNEDVVITKDEWGMMTQAITQAMQAPAPAASPNGGGRPPSEGQAAQGGDEQAIAAGAEALSQIIDGLDPELKAQVGEAISQGVPLKEIIAQLAQA